MKWCDLIDSGDPEPQTLNLIRSSHDLMWVCWWLSLLRCQNTKSRKRLIDDSEVNWRYNMASNIIYAYIKKGVMLDRFNMTLLLNNKSLNDRFWWYQKMKPKRTFWKTSNESKSFKNNISEVLSNRMLFDWRIKNLAWCENNSFLFIIKLFIKILNEYNKKHNYDTCDLTSNLKLTR